jgi:hypothetical protein
MYLCAEVRVFVPLDASTVVGLVKHSCDGRVPFGAEVLMSPDKFRAYTEAVHGRSTWKDATIICGRDMVRVRPVDNIPEPDVVHLLAKGN